MSVIGFSGKEIDGFMSKLAGCNHGSVFENVCRYHQWAAVQRRQYDRDCQNSTEKESTDKGFAGYMINALGYYLAISNRIAYGLTYKDEPVDFHDDMGEEIVPQHWHSVKEVYSGLRHLDYNLCSNGGTVFMAEGWGDFWRACKEAVAAAAID